MEIYQVMQYHTYTVIFEGLIFRIFAIIFSISFYGMYPDKGKFEGENFTGSKVVIKT